MKILRHTLLSIATLCSFAYADVDVVLLNDVVNVKIFYAMSGQGSTIGSEKIFLKRRSFEERAPGVFFLASAPIDSGELEFLLKNPRVSFVVLDDRCEYSYGGDKTIQANRDFIQNWYKQAKVTIGEQNIHKLVWLPKQKVVDDLMSRMSFVPESWLLKMDRYYALYRGG